MEPKFSHPAARKPIEGFEHYLIFENGKVFNMKRGRFLKPSKTATGYLMVILGANGKRKGFLLHRLVAAAFLDNCENRKVVNHLDGVKTNCHVSNLAWATYGENSRHAVRSGLIERRKGSNHHSAKFTEAEIMDIRSRHAGGERQTSIAKTFGVMPATINGIIKRKTWKHVKETESFAS